MSAELVPERLLSVPRTHAESIPQRIATGGTDEEAGYRVNEALIRVPLWRSEISDFGPGPVAERRDGDTEGLEDPCETMKSQDCTGGEHDEPARVLREQAAGQQRNGSAGEQPRERAENALRGDSFIHDAAILPRERPRYLML